MAADLCWLRQDRQHRSAIAKLFALAVRHAALLGAREIGQLFYTARCLGRMPEQQMLVRTTLSCAFPCSITEEVRSH